MGVTLLEVRCKKIMRFILSERLKTSPFVYEAVILSCRESKKTHSN